MVKFNYGWRLNRQIDGMCYNKKFYYVLDALWELIDKKGLKVQSCKPSFIDEESFLSLHEYNELQIAARLFTFVGKCPKEIKNYNIAFLCGIKTDTAPVEDNELIEKYENEGFELVWLIIGENAEIKMLAYVSKRDGYVMPILDKEIESDYGKSNKDNVDPKFWGQYRGEEDGYEYISELYDFLYFPKDNYSYSLETDNYLTDQDDIDYEDMDDNADNEEEEEEDEWIENIEDAEEDEEEEDEWIENIEDAEEDEEEDDEWIENIEDAEEDEWSYLDNEWIDCIDENDNVEEDINKALDMESELFNKSSIDITVLSVTDLQGQQRTLKDGAFYDNIQGFVGKIFPIVIGKEISIFDPESNIVPIPDEKLHTSSVMFHSEEFISENEIKHIVRTKDSIYTFIEYKN